MKHKKPGAIRGPTNRRPAPDGFLEVAFDWRTTHMTPLQQILLNSDGEIPIRRRWFEWTPDGWREIE